MHKVFGQKEEGWKRKYKRFYGIQQMYEWDGGAEYIWNCFMIT